MAGIRNIPAACLVIRMICIPCLCRFISANTVRWQPKKQSSCSSRLQGLFVYCVSVFSQPTRYSEVHPSYLENDLSSLTLDKIEQELRLMNVNLAEANDIAMLAAFKAMPPELDNDSRKALTLLRAKMMTRARDRAGV